MKVRRQVAGNRRGLYDIAVEGVKLAKKEELAPAVNTATRVGSLAISHRNAKETRNARETRIGYPADRTGFSRRFNIPSV